MSPTRLTSEHELDELLRGARAPDTLEALVYETRWNASLFHHSATATCTRVADGAGYDVVSSYETGQSAYQRNAYQGDREVHLKLRRRVPRGASVLGSQVSASRAQSQAPAVTLGRTPGSTPGVPTLAQLHSSQDIWTYEGLRLGLEPFGNRLLNLCEDFVEALPEPPTPDAPPRRLLSLRPAIRVSHLGWLNVLFWNDRDRDRAFALTPEGEVVAYDTSEAEPQPLVVGPLLLGCLMACEDMDASSPGSILQGLDRLRRYPTATWRELSGGPFIYPPEVAETALEYAAKNLQAASRPEPWFGVHPRFVATP